MWVYNVTRELIQTSGLKVVPESVPKLDREHERAGREGAVRDDRAITVVKVHHAIAPDTPNSLYLVTWRDLRDAMMSFMRFMEVDFERGLDFLRTAVPLQAYFLSFPSDKTMTIDYRAIVQQPRDTIAAIAARLGLAVDEADVDRVLSKFTKEAVAKRLSEREDELRQHLRDRQSLPRDKFVPSGRPNSIRAFDPETGFQTGHVSPYRDGAWREVLTADQLREMDALVRKLVGDRARS